MLVTRSAVLEQLTRAQTLGFLGNGPVADHLDHASSLVALCGPVGGRVVADLGSGGGVPGFAWLLCDGVPNLVLVERSARRAAFLRSCVISLGVDSWVSVRTESAESASWSPDLRGMCAAVTARSFAPPPTTLECGGGLLGIGGRLVVSEPPDSDRWSSVALGEYGISLDSRVAAPVSAVVLVRSGPWPEHLPRSERVTRKNPLW